MSDKSVDEFTARRLFVAWDRHVERIATLHRTRRRMKLSFIALGAGTLLVVTESLGLALAMQATQRPAMLEYWGPLSAVGVALVAFATLRTAFGAHKEHVLATLATKASKDELLAIHNSIESLSANVNHMRELLEKLLQERRG